MMSEYGLSLKLNIDLKLGHSLVLDIGHGLSPKKSHYQDAGLKHNFKLINLKFLFFEILKSC